LLGYINGLPPATRARLLAIANTKDQNRLARTALHDPDLTNRSVAVHALTDQKLLTSVAGESQDESIRHIAADRLTGEDQPSLLKLIASTKDTRVRVRATARVDDPALRARFEDEADPKAAAVRKKYATQESDRILNSKDMGDRLRAVEVAVDVDVLFKAATEDPDPQTGRQGGEKVARIAKNRKKRDRRNNV